MASPAGWSLEINLLHRATFLSFCAIVCYVATLLPTLIAHRFDTSIFIVAGDRFVDATKTPAPIVIRRGEGYDGQFYYRSATSPLDLTEEANGVRFDNAPWRMQRIGYPAIAWALSLGHPNQVPMALLATNLLGIGLIGFLATLITRQLSLPSLTPLGIVFWPGLIITLSRDTTEIVALAFLLASLSSLFAKRLVLLALFGTLTVLTRETAIFAFAGLFVYAAFVRNGRLLAATAVVGEVFLTWRLLLTWATGQSPPTTDLGWPMVGFAQTVMRILSGTYSAHHGIKWLMFHTYAALSVASLLQLLSVRWPECAARSTEKPRLHSRSCLCSDLCRFSTPTAHGPSP